MSQKADLGRVLGFSAIRPKVFQEAGGGKRKRLKTAYTGTYHVYMMIRRPLVGEWLRMCERANQKSRHECCCCSLLILTVKKG